MVQPSDEKVEAAKHRFFRGASQLELERLITIAEVSDLTGLSQDSVRRHYGHFIRRLSPRRLGMRLGDALSIGETT
jgi:hypothetical protein